MKQIYIPTIGTELILAETWIPSIMAERRNHTFVKKILNLDIQYLFNPNYYEMFYTEFITHLNRDIFKEVNNLDMYKNFIDNYYYNEIRNIINNNDIITIEILKELNIILIDGIKTNNIKKFVEIEFVPDTILIVDRIYIKQRLSDFDSVSFRIKYNPLFPKIKGRFWTHLKYVNTLKIK